MKSNPTGWTDPSGKFAYQCCSRFIKLQDALGLNNAACARRLLGDFAARANEAARIGASVVSLTYQVLGGTTPAGVIAISITGGLIDSIAKNYCATCYCLRSANPTVRRVSSCWLYRVHEYKCEDGMRVYPSEYISGGYRDATVLLGGGCPGGSASGSQFVSWDP